MLIIVQPNLFNFFVEYNFLVLGLKMKKLKHIYLILLNPKY
jgi:hypothetical protein